MSSLNLKNITVGPIRTNAYLFDCGDGLAVVDPGDDADKILSEAQKAGKQIKHILLTHSHWDHIGAVNELKKLGAKVYVHKEEVQILHSEINPDILLDGSEVLKLGGREVKVLHTPGHTAGSVCYIVDYKQENPNVPQSVMFSGDTLFYLEIGRCDLPTGNFNTMKKTLKKLFALDTDYKVLPGHGKSTSIFFERDNNPYAE